MKLGCTVVRRWSPLAAWWSTLPRTVGHRSPCVCMVQYTCTFPISLPGSWSPTQADGAFPRPALSWFCVSRLSNIPSRAAPRKRGKGNGCSLDLETKEWAKHNKWVKHSCAEAGASLEYGAWSGNWFSSLLCSPNFLTHILCPPPWCADAVPCFRHVSESYQSPPEIHK